MFGLGFGMVAQVLDGRGPERRRPRARSASRRPPTSFFRALGGAVGAAVLGAVFAAQAGTSAGGGVLGRADPALASAVTDAVQHVFLVAAPIALAGALVVLRLPGAALRTESPGAGVGACERLTGGPEDGRAPSRCTCGPTDDPHLAPHPPPHGRAAAQRALRRLAGGHR